MSRRTTAARRSDAELVLSVAEMRETAQAVDVSEVDDLSELALPSDHPRWRRDRFTVTSATKALLERIVPIAIRVFGFWDHRVHRLALEGSTIEVDPCGSYRCDSRPMTLENSQI